jgi:hypothetical protein
VPDLAGRTLWDGVGAPLKVPTDLWAVKREERDVVLVSTACGLVLVDVLGFRVGLGLEAQRTEMAR